MLHFTDEENETFENEVILRSITSQSRTRSRSSDPPLAFIYGMGCINNTCNFFERQNCAYHNFIVPVHSSKQKLPMKTMKIKS